MWNLVKNTSIDSSSMGHHNGLPNEINVIIADHARMQAKSMLPSSNPTHVLAIWDLPVPHPVYKNGTGNINPATGRRKISLMPAHNLVLAAHCAKWFPLPKSETVRETPVRSASGVPGTMLGFIILQQDVIGTRLESSSSARIRLEQATDERQDPSVRQP